MTLHKKVGKGIFRMQINPNNQLNISNLPTEILVNTFDFLDERTLRATQRVSKAFYQIASEDSIWRKFVVRHLGLTLGDFRGSHFTYCTSREPMFLQDMSRELTPNMPIHLQFIEYKKRYYRFFRTLFSLEQNETKFNVQKFIKNNPIIIATTLSNCITKDKTQRMLEKKYGCPERGHSLELGFILFSGIKPKLESIQEALENQASLCIMNLLLKKIDKIDREDVKILLLNSPFTTLEIFEIAIKNGYLFYKSDLGSCDKNCPIFNFLQEHALPDPTDSDGEYDEPLDTDEWSGNQELFQKSEITFTSICGIQ